jgi:hypothetical protein
VEKHGLLKNIGEIDHLIIDKLSGRVAYAVMSFGGFMGFGHSHYPIPWGALTYDKSLGGFRTNITEQQLKDAPEFSDDSWQDRDWEVRTHRHYRAPEYWETRGGDIAARNGSAQKMTGFLQTVRRLIPSPALNRPERACTRLGRCAISQQRRQPP